MPSAESTLLSTEMECSRHEKEQKNINLNLSQAITQEVYEEVESLENLNTTVQNSLNIKLSQTISREFSNEVEGLVIEIKENLSLTPSSKSLSCSHFSRKSSRASPYRIPSKNHSDIFKVRKMPSHEPKEDPYEVLQKLIRDGGLVSEAVRRLRFGQAQQYTIETGEVQPVVVQVVPLNDMST